VETEEQAATLKQMGYHFGQGYLWAKPMPLAQALAWRTGAPTQSPSGTRYV